LSSAARTISSSSPSSNETHEREDQLHGSNESETLDITAKFNEVFLLQGHKTMTTQHGVNDTAAWTMDTEMRWISASQEWCWCKRIDIDSLFQKIPVVTSKRLNQENS
jgi:hypothetical protein